MSNMEIKLTYFIFIVNKYANKWMNVVLEYTNDS